MTIENDVTFAEDASQVRTGNAHTSWRPCATWPSARSTATRRTSRSIWPPRCATTAATPADHWPSSGSRSDETDI